MKEYLNILFNGNSLNSEQAEIVMNYIIEGKYSNEQISAFLGALRSRGEKVEEIVGFVRAMRKKAVKIDIDNKHLIDVCELVEMEKILLIFLLLQLLLLQLQAFQ